MYEKLKQAIQDGMYTVTEAVNLLNAFCKPDRLQQTNLRNYLK